MRTLLKLLRGLTLFLAGAVFGHLADKFVSPFIDDFSWDLTKYAHVTSYWLKTHYPGAAGDRARCEEGPRIDILQEEARFQYWNKRAANCNTSSSPFADDNHAPDCSGEEKHCSDHLAKLEDAKKKLAACSPQTPPKPHP